MRASNAESVPLTRENNDLASLSLSSVPLLSSRTLPILSVLRTLRHQTPLITHCRCRSARYKPDPFRSRETAENFATRFYEHFHWESRLREAKFLSRMQRMKIANAIIENWQDMRAMWKSIEDRKSILVIFGIENDKANHLNSRNIPRRIISFLPFSFSLRSLMRKLSNLYIIYYHNLSCLLIFPILISLLILIFSFFLTRSPEKLIRVRIFFRSVPRILNNFHVKW